MVLWIECLHWIELISNPNLDGQIHSDLSYNGHIPAHVSRLCYLLFLPNRILPNHTSSCISLQNCISLNLNWQISSLHRYFPNLYLLNIVILWYCRQIVLHSLIPAQSFFLSIHPSIDLCLVQEMQMFVSRCLCLKLNRVKFYWKVRQNFLDFSKDFFSNETRMKLELGIKLSIFVFHNLLARLFYEHQNQSFNPLTI